MDYKIRNIQVYGITTPLLNVDLDVSNKCKYIVIKSNDKIFKKLNVKVATNNFKLNFVNVTEKLPKNSQKVISV